MTIVVCVIIGIIWFVCWLIYRIVKAVARGVKNEYNDRKQERRMETIAQIDMFQERIDDARRLEHEQSAAVIAMVEAERYRKEEYTKSTWLSSISQTKILDRHRKYASNRQYTIQTTFMIYYQDGAHEARTVENGTELYDELMSRLE